MSTSVEGKVARALGYGSLAHITSAPEDEITPEGVLFDGTLTDTQVGEVWWFITSRDDVDQAQRQALYVRLSEAVAVTPPTWESSVLAEILRHQIGLTP